MTPVLVDTFDAPDGSPWDAELWVTSVAVNGAVTVEDGRGALTVMGGGGGDSAAQAIGLTDALDGCELTLNLSYPLFGANAWRVFLRASGDWAARGWPTRGYCVESSLVDETIHLRRRDPDGTITTLDSATVTKGDPLTSPTWLRFKAEGDALSARLWVDGDDEPDTWDLQAVDGTYSTGVLQLTHQRVGNNFTVTVDDVALWALGEAPTPPGAPSWADPALQLLADPLRVRASWVPGDGAETHRLRRQRWLGGGDPP